MLENSRDEREIVREALAVLLTTAKAIRLSVQAMPDEVRIPTEFHELWERTLLNVACVIGDVSGISADEVVEHASRWEDADEDDESLMNLVGDIDALDELEEEK